MLAGDPETEARGLVGLRLGVERLSGPASGARAGWPGGAAPQASCTEAPPDTRAGFVEACVALAFQSRAWYWPSILFWLLRAYN